MSIAFIFSAIVVGMIIAILPFVGIFGFLELRDNKNHSINMKCFIAAISTISIAFTLCIIGFILDCLFG